MVLQEEIYNDQDLISLLKYDEQAALKHIYAKYWKQLYLSAYTIIRDDAQCQDIVQDVILQMWIRKNDVVIESLKSYLFTAVKYKVLTYIKSAGNRKVFIEPGELEKLAGMEELKDRLAENDINHLVDVNISSLPKRCQQIFLLSRKEYLSNKEIAERMGISVKTVENQMTIALRHLRKSMGNHVFWISVMLPLIYK